MCEVIFATFHLYPHSFIHHYQQTRRMGLFENNLKICIHEMFSIKNDFHIFYQLLFSRIHSIFFRYVLVNKEEFYFILETKEVKKFKNFQKNFYKKISEFFFETLKKAFLKFI